MLSSFKPELILLDLDGTLIDSVPDLATAIDAMMGALGRPPCGEEAVRNWVGNGVQRLVERALSGSLDGQPDQATYAQAYPLFMTEYAARNCHRSTLYPGVYEGLQALHRHGYRLGCVTNKATRFTVPLLAQFKLGDFFSILICGDTLPEHKPSPLPLLHAAQTLSVTPEHCLMVGDSINDVQAARAAGFRVVCMSYGYNHGNDIRDAHPDAVLDSLTELEPLLHER